MWWLRDVDIDIEEGQLVCVVGRVGSGKSSLVSALLGEMQCAGGRVALGGAIAYVAQQPWIINDTVQNNITFGLDYDEERWDDVVHVRLAFLMKPLRGIKLEHIHQARGFIGWEPLDLVSIISES